MRSERINNLWSFIYEYINRAAGSLTTSLSLLPYVSPLFSSSSSSFLVAQSQMYFWKDRFNKIDPLSHLYLSCSYITALIIVLCWFFMPCRHVQWLTWTCCKIQAHCHTWFTSSSDLSVPYVGFHATPFQSTQPKQKSFKTEAQEKRRASNVSWHSAAWASKATYTRAQHRRFF